MKRICKGGNARAARRRSRRKRSQPASARLARPNSKLRKQALRGAQHFQRRDSRFPGGSRGKRRQGCARRSRRGRRIIRSQRRPRIDFAGERIAASPNSSGTSVNASAGNSPVVNVSPAPTPPVSIRPWAPPDVDAKEYVVAPDVACSLDTVLQRTQMRTMKQIANFEKFMATEHIEHQEIDAYGNPGAIRSKDFTYLVFITKQKSGSLLLDEQRDGGENLNEFPTSLASRGLVGLGVFLFDPEYQNDVTYRCEGLSEWRGQAAWEMRFEQKRDVESRLRTWRTQSRCLSRRAERPRVGFFQHLRCVASRNRSARSHVANRTRSRPSRDRLWSGEFQSRRDIAVAAVVRRNVHADSWQALPSPPHAHELRALLRGHRPPDQRSEGFPKRQINL